jgi:transcription antitermination factor NusG
MPLLPPEPFVFPDDLFLDPLAGPPDGQRWLVLHTRPRAEKALTRRFLARARPFFLPLYQKRWRCRGRLLQSHLPLFPGYVFLLGDADARLEALQTNLVANCLPVEDQEQLHVDLLRVHHLMTSGEPLVPEDRLQPGSLVEIIDGPLKGLEGKVLRQGNRLKFFIEVQLLQRGASVEIDSWMIRALNERPALAGV